MGIEQIMESGGKRAEKAGVYKFIPVQTYQDKEQIIIHRGRIPSTKPISEYKKGELISSVPQVPKRKGGVLEVMQTLGVGGLWNVYTTGGAFGSKAATKTVFEEYWKAKDYPMEHLTQIWESPEWMAWAPQTTIPGLPSMQFEAPTFNFPGLPDLGELGKYALIAGVAIAGLFIVGKMIK